MPVLRRKITPRAVQAGTQMETAENRFRSHPMSVRDVVVGRSRNGRRSLRNSTTEARVCATAIVVQYPFSQEPPRMPFIQRKGMGGTLTCRPNQRLADRSRMRQAERSIQLAEMH